MEQPIQDRFGQLSKWQNKGALILNTRFEPFLRRLLDILGALFGLLFLSPVFIFIAYLIKRDTPGPIFYRGLRVGKGGETFGMLKFRTMYEKPTSYQGPRVTGEGDPRITPMGQWLRDTKLNELPQLWNVLMGDMSLFGPRPEDPELVKHWPKDIRDALLSVRPGITSPASIVFRDEEKMMQATGVEAVYLNEILPGKLRLDWLYVKRRVIISDLDVLLWTLVTLLPRVSERKIPDHLLYWGPISRFASRYFSWFTVDALVTFLVIAGLGLIWRSFAPLNVGLDKAVLITFIMVLLFSSANVVLGLNRMWWSKAKAGYALLLFVSTAVATSVILLLNYMLPRPLPATLIIISGLVAWMGFILVRYRLRLVSGAARHWLNARPGITLVGEHVLIVGAGVVGRFAASILSEEDFLPSYSVVGMVDDDPRKNGMQIGDYRVLGTTQEIPELVDKHDVSIIIFAISELAEEVRLRILNSCEQTRARLIFLPDVVHSIQSRFSTPFDYGFAPEPMTSQIDKELQELSVLLQNGLISEAQIKIHALQKEFARGQEASDNK